jgi:hypothetical protein
MVAISLRGLPTLGGAKIGIGVSNPVRIERAYQLATLML